MTDTLTKMEDPKAKIKIDEDQRDLSKIGRGLKKPSKKKGRALSQVFPFSERRKLDLPRDVAEASGLADGQNIETLALSKKLLETILSKQRRITNRLVQDDPSAFRVSFTSMRGNKVKGAVEQTMKQRNTLDVSKEDFPVDEGDFEHGDEETLASFEGLSKAELPSLLREEEDSVSLTSMNVPAELELNADSMKFISKTLVENTPNPDFADYLDTFGTKEDNTLALFHTLFCLVQYPQHLRDLKKCALQLLRALRIFNANPSLSYYGCCVLEKLLGDEKSDRSVFKKKMLAAHAEEVVVGVMDVHSHVASLQSVCCKLLWSLSEGETDSPRVLREEVLEKVIAAMSAFPESDGVQFEACALLQRLAVDDENEEHIGRSGGISYVLEAATSQSLDEEVVKKACAALWNLSFSDQNRREMIDNGAHVEILKVIGKYSEETGNRRPDIVAKACGVLWNLGDLVYGKPILLQNKVPEKMIATMTIFRFDPRVQEMGCGCLRTLAYNDESRIGLMNIGAALKILESMKDHVENQDIQYQAFAVLKKLSCNDVNEGRLVEMQAGQRILEAMSNHLEVASIQGRACGVLWNLAVKDDHKLELIRMGCAEKILDAMRAHRLDEAVQFQTCRTLKRLARESMNEVHLMRLGAAEHVLIAMKTHINNKKIQEKGCGVLWNLSERDEHKRQLMNLGAAEQILESMQRHIDVGDVQYEACGALKRLAVDDQIEVKLMAMNAADYVLKAMKQHKDEADVQGQACGVLWNLAFNGQAQLMKLNAPERILEAMKRHPEKESVQEKACGTLWKLAEIEENNKRLMELKVVDKVIDAMENIRGHPGVQYQACGTLWNLAVRDQNRIPLLEAKAEEKVLNAMRDHSNRADILHSSCGVLFNLAQNDIRIERKFQTELGGFPVQTSVSSRFLLASKGAIQGIVQSIRAQKEQADVVYQAMAALNHIAHDPKTLPYFLVDEGLLEEALSAAKLMMDDPQIQENAVSLVSKVMQGVLVSCKESVKNSTPDLLFVSDEFIKNSLEAMLYVATNQRMIPFIQQKSVLFFNNVYELMSLREKQCEEKYQSSRNSVMSDSRNSDMGSFISESTFAWKNSMNFDESYKLKKNTMKVQFESQVLTKGHFTKIIDRVVWFLSENATEERALSMCAILLKNMLQDVAEHPGNDFFLQVKEAVMSHKSLQQSVKQLFLETTSPLVRIDCLWVIRMLVHTLSSSEELQEFTSPDFIFALCNFLQTDHRPQFASVGLITLQLLLDTGSMAEEAVSFEQTFATTLLQVFKKSTELINAGSKKAKLGIRAACNFLVNANFDKETLFRSFIASKGLDEISEVINLADSVEENYVLGVDALVLLLKMTENARVVEALVKDASSKKLRRVCRLVLGNILKTGFGYVSSRTPVRPDSLLKRSTRWQKSQFSRTFSKNSRRRKRLSGRGSKRMEPLPEKEKIQKQTSVAMRFRKPEVALELISKSIDLLQFWQSVHPRLVAGKEDAEQLQFIANLSHLKTTKVKPNLSKKAVKLLKKVEDFRAKVKTLGSGSRKKDSVSI